MFLKNKKIIQIGSVIVFLLVILIISSIFVWQRSITTSSAAETPVTVTIATFTITVMPQAPTPITLPHVTPAPIITTTPIALSNVPTDIPKLVVPESETHSFNVQQINPLDGGQEEKVLFPEYARVLAVRPDGEFITQSRNYGLASTIDIDQLLTTSLATQIWPFVLTPPDSNYIIVAAREPAFQPQSIWAMFADNRDPLLIGTTSSFPPRFASTVDGKVLLLENGYLTLKWIDNDILYEQSLAWVHEQLNLNWSEVDLTQSPDYVTIPYVDFSISPNGEWLALFDGIQGKLWLVSITDYTVRDVQIPPIEVSEGTGPIVLFRDWSPDSQWVGYKLDIWSDKLVDTYPRLQIVSVNDNIPRTLIDGREYKGLTLAWSPNNQALAIGALSIDYTTVPERTLSYLFISDQYGNGSREIPNTYYGDNVQSLFWQPDGQVLNYRCRQYTDDNFIDGVCSVAIND